MRTVYECYSKPHLEAVLLDVLNIDYAAALLIASEAAHTTGRKLVLKTSTLVEIGDPVPIPDTDNEQRRVVNTANIRHWEITIYDHPRIYLLKGRGGGHPGGEEA
jgi:hypothetical protein